ncbi:MAG: DUF308 domain-containing protein [Gammaproteobacteria bacterium]
MKNSNMHDKIEKNYSWHLAQSIIFIVFGLTAIFVPRITALSLELLIGVLLFLSGFFALVTNIKSEMTWGTCASALLFVLAGLFMLLKPILGLDILSMLLTIYLVFKGASDIYLAYQYRPKDNRQWLLISGIITLVLASIAWYGFPEVGILFLGVILGLNMFIYGISLLVVTWSVKKNNQLE